MREQMLGSVREVIQKDIGAAVKRGEAFFLM